MKTTFVLPTGYGKSFVALKILKQLNPTQVFIAVNSTDLRDHGWKREFEKFGMKEFYEKRVTVKTYQYLYKQKTLDFKVPSDTVVILDEIDFIAGTEKLARAMNLFLRTRVIGLTGFITYKKLAWFKANLPVSIALTTEEAQEIGLLNQVKYYFVKYLLSDEETKQYLKYEGSINANMASRGALYADYFAGKVDKAEYEYEVNKFSKRLEYTINARAMFLTKLNTSAKLTRKLLRHIHASKEHTKSIVFSKLVEQAEKISKVVYSGANSNKENKEIFRKFNSSEISNMGAISKINRGVNIDNLNVGIWEGFYGSDTQFIQQRGRLLRLDPKEVAHAYILLPYYKNSKGEWVETQAVAWARKMTSKTSIKDFKIWQYDKV